MQSRLIHTETDRGSIGCKTLFGVKSLRDMAFIDHHDEVLACIEQIRTVVDRNAVVVWADPIWIWELFFEKSVIIRSRFGVSIGDLLCIDVFAASGVDPARLEIARSVFFYHRVELDAGNWLHVEFFTFFWQIMHFDGDRAVFCAEFESFYVCWEVCIARFDAHLEVWLHEKIS